MFQNVYLGRRKRNSLLTRIIANEPQNTDPKTLYKKALLTWDPNTREVSLSPLAFPKKVSFNAKAECLQSTHYINYLTRNEVPSKACTCGFYAYTEEEDAKNHIQAGADSFVLKVVASGKLLEYKKGYRYGHQRVEEVLVYNCYGCQKPADRVIIFGKRVLPTCKSHSRGVRPIYKVSFAEMSEMASRSLPSHSPRIVFRPAASEVKPWVSDMDIKRLTKKPSKIVEMLYAHVPEFAIVSLVTLTPYVFYIAM